MFVKKIKIIGLCFLLLAGMACSTDEPSNNNNVDNQEDTVNQNPLPVAAAITLDVPYGEHEAQTYDLYLPANRSSSKTKVIVLVHGGGWTSGDKSGMTEFVNLIQEEAPEYAIVNLNYVLADSETPAFPNQFLDIKLALLQLQDQAVSLKIKPEFALIGTSAGAHLSLMFDYVYDTDDLVKMVASIVGPTDFTDPFYSDDPVFGFLLSQLVDESAYQEGADYATLTSPALQASESSAPTIMFYGSDDPLVPLTNGTRLEEALASNSVSHSFTVYNGGHGDDWSSADYQNLELQLLDYLNVYLPIEE